MHCSTQALHLNTRETFFLRQQVLHRLNMLFLGQSLKGHELFQFNKGESRGPTVLDVAPIRLACVCQIVCLMYYVCQVVTCLDLCAFTV